MVWININANLEELYYTNENLEGLEYPHELKIETM